MAGKKGQQGTKAREVAERYDERFLDDMDGRFETVRTLRQRLAALTNDLGGVANLSYQEQSVCKRAVHLERLIEKKESTLAHGGNVDENAYFSAITTLSSLFSKVGLKRRPKVVGTLAELLSQQQEPTA